MKNQRTAFLNLKLPLFKVDSQLNCKLFQMNSFLTKINPHFAKNMPQIALLYVNKYKVLFYDFS